MMKFLGRGLRGFTLVELMVTLTIIIIVVVGLLVSYVYCLLLNESNHNLVVASNDAQYVLEQIKGTAFSSISNFITNFNSTQFSNLGNETVTFSGLEYGSELTKVTVNVNWVERERQRTFGLSSWFAP